MTISLFLVAMTALGLLGALGLFVSLKREVEARSRREAERVEAMLARLVEAETRWAPQPLPAIEPKLVVPRSGLNLSKRVQVMRLLRQGEDTSRIAAALGLSRAEVQLLASVETLASSGLRKAAGAQ
jgi:hypothetical protein